MSDTLELVERECIGGCGRKFKVLPNSPHQTYFTDCKTRCTNAKKDLEETKKLFNPDHGQVPMKSAKRDWISILREPNPFRYVPEKQLE